MAVPNEISKTLDLSALSKALPSTSLETLAKEFPEGSVTVNPLDYFRANIAEAVSKAITIDKHLLFPALSFTATLDKGDLVIAVPRLNRVKGVVPAELAKEWSAKVPENKLFKVSASDINLRFDFTPLALTSVVLPSILSLGESYGLNPYVGLKDPANPAAGKKKVIVEFSSPNIAKKFHAGHLRSTIIGGFLSNLYASNGHEVIKLNYLGDWGRQYGLLAIAYQKYGDEEAFKKDPIAFLFEIYVKISADFKPEEEAYEAAKKNKQDTTALENSGILGEAKRYFKRMEDGDPEALALWSRFRELSIAQYKKTYARLNIDFTYYSGESTVKQETMIEAEKILKDKGLAEESDGALIIDFKKHGAKKLDVAILRNRNGTSNYLTRDIGSAMQREREFHMDEMLYVVMSEQEMHLKRLYKTLELMGEPFSHTGKNCVHITYGKVMGMSTRKGNVAFLDDIIDDVAAKMHEVMKTNEEKYKQVVEPEKVAEILGISSIMVQDMSGKRINNYPFQIDRMTSFEGDTGPYLQYAHARLCSINRKTGYTSAQLTAADFSLLKEKHALDLIRIMGLYPEMVKQTLKTLEPTTILTYLFKFTHQISSTYDVLRVINPPEGEATGLARAALYEAARQIVRNGMVLLGLRPVERM